MQKKAWILKDYKVGSTTQMMSLARALELDIKIKNIEYRPWISKLPNFLLQGIWHIDSRKSDSLDLSSNTPEVVISAGRRGGLISVYLKKLLPKLKIINIMRPLKEPNFFDYIILPHHDLRNQVNDNVITVIGSLNDAKLQIEQAKDLDIPEFIGIIIGGSAQRFNFLDTDDTRLIELIRKVTDEASYKIVISFSRRTSPRTKKKIKEEFTQSIIYDPESKEDNIYYSILKSAKFIICTADSISMCSEVVSSGKPCYLYLPLQIAKSLKHVRFVDHLINQNIARLLDDNVRLGNYSYTPLEEVRRITRLIKL